MQNRLEERRSQVHHSASVSECPVTRILDAAAKTSTPVKIRYFGGSEPSASRFITPIELLGRGSRKPEYVRAFCHLRRTNRTFRIDLIEIPSTDNLKGRQHVARGVQYSLRRSPYSVGDAGREAAIRHIKEAQQFSREMGGTDAHVKAYFLSLPDAELDAILSAYGRQYGSSKGAYARQTLPYWRNGTTAMSGLVAKRLFEFLPSRMPLKMKFELAEKLWRHVGPKSNHSYVLGPRASVAAVADQISARLDEVVGAYRVPEHIRSRFNWLAAGDVRVQEQLLNHFRKMAKTLAIEKVNLELPVLQRQVRDHGDVTRRAKSVVQVHKHEIELWVDGTLEDQICEGRPAVERNLDPGGFGWIWWVVGIAVLLLLLSR